MSVMWNFKDYIENFNKDMDFFADYIADNLGLKKDFPNEDSDRTDEEHWELEAK